MSLRLVVGAVLVIGCGGDDGSSVPQDGPNDTGDPIVVPEDSAGNPTTSVDLGAALVGQSATASFVLTNSGTAASGPIALAIGGTHANDFAFDNQLTTCAGLALTPGTSCDVVLVFRPTAAGARAASLTITTQPGGVVTVALAGQAAVPDLHFVPSSFTFATIEIGQTAHASLELHNSGADAAPIDGLVVSGTDFMRGLSTCGSSLAAGTSCDIAVQVTPQSLGTASGSLVVTSGGGDFVAMLSAPAAHRVSVSRSGNGSGTITSSPSAINCGSSCTALFTGDVVLTAAAGAGSILTSWSVPGCGTSATCTVPASVDPVTVVASFALTGSGQLDVTFAGDAPGELEVNDTICFASCSVPIEPGQGVSIEAVTPSTFGGFAGACTGTSTSCSFTAAAGVTNLTATFSKHPNERWTRLLTGGRLQAAGYDSAGNLVVASFTQMTKLSPTGSTLWTQSRSVLAFAIAPDDTIYVHGDSTLVKLDADGSQVWSRATDANTSTCANGTVGPSRCIAVGSDGAVAIHGTGVGRWDAAGTPTWSKPVSFGANGIGIDLQGVVVVAAKSFETMRGLRFAPADGASLTALEDVSPSYQGMLARDPAGRLITSSDNRGLIAYSVEGTASGEFLIETVTELGTAIVSSASGQFALMHDRPEDGWTVMGPSWSVTRHRAGDYGTATHDLAISSANKVALVGWYQSLTFQGSWVQTFDP